MGKFVCPSGYYKGWTDDADHATMDAEKCAVHCNKEPECLYFAIKPFQTCSRFNSGAGDCPLEENPDHELYKKMGTYIVWFIFIAAPRYNILSIHLFTRALFIFKRQE